MISVPVGEDSGRGLPGSFGCGQGVSKSVVLFQGLPEGGSASKPSPWLSAGSRASGAFEWRVSASHWLLAGALPPFLATGGGEPLTGQLTAWQFVSSEQEGKKSQRKRQTARQKSIFYNLIRKGHPITFAIFSLLEASCWVQLTFNGGREYTWRWVLGGGWEQF